MGSLSLSSFQRKRTFLEEESFPSQEVSTFSTNFFVRNFLQGFSYNKRRHFPPRKRENAKTSSLHPKPLLIIGRRELSSLHGIFMSH